MLPHSCLTVGQNNPKNLPKPKIGECDVKLMNVCLFLRYPSRLPGWGSLCGQRGGGPVTSAWHTQRNNFPFIISRVRVLLPHWASKRTALSKLFASSLQSSDNNHLTNPTKHGGNCLHVHSPCFFTADRSSHCCHPPSLQFSYANISVFSKKTTVSEWLSNHEWTLFDLMVWGQAGFMLLVWWWDGSEMEGLFSALFTNTQTKIETRLRVGMQRFIDNDKDQWQICQGI